MKQTVETGHSGDASAVKELLQEANKILKSLTKEEASSRAEAAEDKRSPTLQGLQK